MLGATTLQLGNSKMYNCNASTSSTSTSTSSRIDSSPPTGSTAMLHQFQQNVPNLYLNARIPPTQTNIYGSSSVKIESEVSPQNDNDTASNSDADEGANGYGDGGDAEGVWSADIEQAFQEALAVYPPCGRRKIILQEEGRMYGRNELIARYIKIRTNKTRTRKQVSSHIQVLARKKQREFKELDKPQEHSRDQMRADHSKPRADSYTPPQKKLKSIKKEAAPESNNLSMTPMSRMSLDATMPTVSSAAISASNSAFMPPPLGTNQNATFLNQFIISGQQLSQSLPLGFPSMPFVFNNGSLLTVASGAQTPLNFAGSTLLPTQSTCASVPCIKGANMSLIKFVAYVEESGVTERKKHDLVRVDIDAMYDIDDPNKPSNRSEAIKLEQLDVSNSLIRDHFKSENDKLEEIIRSSADASQSCFIAKCWGTVDYPSNSKDMSFAYDARYETDEPYQIEISTRVISCGRRILEKVEREKPTFCPESKKYVYEIENSSMCDYIRKFVEELRKLKSIEDMDRVLNLLTILHVVSGKMQGSNESKVLLCVAFFFKMSTSDSCTPTVTRVFKIVDQERRT